MDYRDLILIFTSIIYEALPFIVLGVVIAGLLEEFVPQQAITKIIPSSRPLAIALGGVLGLVFPMCECGIIVVMKRLLRKGLPLSVCVCYMLAGPVINGVVILSTYVAFNPPDPSAGIFGGPLNVVLLRCGLAFIIANVTALVVEVLWKKHGTSLLHPQVVKGLKEGILEGKGQEDDNGAQEKKPWAQRLNNITETALHDFVDIMAFLVLGAILAASGRMIVKELNLESVIGIPAVSILIMMGLAVLFCLCSEADAFVAANFSTVWPPASKLAFLVLGPMLDIKLYLMYTRVFRPRLIITIMLVVAVQVFLLALVVHYGWPMIAPYGPTTGAK